MAMYNYSPSLFVVTVNTRQITDWGESATPYTDSPIDPQTTLRRGQGGGAVRMDRINPGRSVTLSVNPGSPDSAYLQSLLNSGSNITLTSTQIGTLENSIGTEGVVINCGQVGRGGTGVSDDTYEFQFNSWTSIKGSN